MLMHASKTTDYNMARWTRRQVYGVAKHWYGPHSLYRDGVDDNMELRL